jgi:hypothetical protein
MVAATLNLLDLKLFHFFGGKHLIRVLIWNELNSFRERFFWLKVSESKLSPIILTP